jgi:hypothetical protein
VTRGWFRRTGGDEDERAGLAKAPVKRPPGRTCGELGMIGGADRQLEPTPRQLLTLEQRRCIHRKRFTHLMGMIAAA